MGNLGRITRRRLSWAWPGGCCSLVQPRCCSATSPPATSPPWVCRCRHGESAWPERVRACVIPLWRRRASLHAVAAAAPPSPAARSCSAGRVARGWRSHSPLLVFQLGKSAAPEKPRHAAYSGWLSPNGLSGRSLTRRKPRNEVAAGKAGREALLHLFAGHPRAGGRNEASGARVDRCIPRTVGGCCRQKQPREV